MKTLKGQFEVKGTPLEIDEATKAVGAMRMMFHKKFTGALDGTSVVSMIGIMDRALGSGAYVALECFIGHVDGKSGSFSMYHSSAMLRGKPEQSIRVVPDSGTEELAGMSGQMTIDIVSGDHFYTFEYAIEKN